MSLQPTIDDYKFTNYRPQDFTQEWYRLSTQYFPGAPNRRDQTTGKGGLTPPSYMNLGQLVSPYYGKVGMGDYSSTHSSGKYGTPNNPVSYNVSYVYPPFTESPVIGSGIKPTFCSDGYRNTFGRRT